MSGTNTFGYMLISELAGKYPEVPVDPTVIEGIKADDPSAFFVTLKIGQVGGYSRNRKKKFSQREVAEIVDRVNLVKPEGRVGHMPLEKRAESLPAIQWLGAVVDNDGTAWGKCYVMDNEVRTYLKTRMRANAPVGTSVWGDVMQHPNGDWTDIQITAIDLSGHPDAVSVLGTRGVPIITAETIVGDDQGNNDGDNLMPDILEMADNTRDVSNLTGTDLKVPNAYANSSASARVTDVTAPVQAVVAETTDRPEPQEPPEGTGDQSDDETVETPSTEAEPETVAETVTTVPQTMLVSIAELLAQPEAAVLTRIGELQQAEADLNAIRTKIAEQADMYARMEINITGYGSDIPALLNDVAEKVESMRSAVTRMKAEELVQGNVQLEGLRVYAREYISELLDARPDLSEAAVLEHLNKFLDRPTTKKIAELMVSETAGGRIFNPETPDKLKGSGSAAGVKSDEELRQLGRRFVESVSK